MKIKVYIDGKQKSCKANGIYDTETNNLIVKKNSIIVPHVNENIRIAKTVNRYWNDEKYVKNRKVLQDIEFTSPTTAAQFVLDSVVNGKKRWKLENGLTLSDYIKKL